jgi:hypothetical protein
MTAESSLSLATESTPEGEQTLVPGVTPISPRQRLEAEMRAPLQPQRVQQPMTIGLFDEDRRRQLHLF